ncbi:23S rRNA (adenine(2503)-C(2))-methyltransferase RlmN [Sorangium sp. So ce281]|uniref:23S rRNA (adenine(2503)-C(2))-methyltransferase RlmN n=1 Tax=unclassified Sorangium TaxID=2621164 RepID=UPI003F610CFA
MRVPEIPEEMASPPRAGDPPAQVAGRPLIRRSARVPGWRARLADHDAASLAELLRRAGGTASAARAVSGKVVRHAFGAEPGAPAPAWDARALAALGVGAWAHEALLALDPAPSLEIAERAPAQDDTLRLVLRARDGALIESVLIPGPARTTLCVSSQVGCARACSFCETGRLGLERQLAAGEIVDQVRIARALAAERGGAPLRNLVFMGMGEPFDNLGEVLKAIRLLTDPRAFRFAPSHVTVSTVGVADKIEPFFREARAELAVSLNAPDDARRRAIMPVNARFSMAALKDAIARALPQGRRVLFEYVLFDRVNDAPEDADLLAAYVAGLRCRVNVIPCNPGPDPALRPPSAARLDAFVARLSGHGVTTLVRRPRGRDVGGACGQLAGMARVRQPAPA